MTDNLDGVSVQFVSNIDEASEFARWMSTKDRIAFDTETTGLNSMKDRVRILQIGDDRTAWVLPIEMPRSWGGLAVDILSQFRGKVIGHNTKFDHNFCRNTLGLVFDWNQYECTMMMSRVLHPLKSAALKTLTTEYVDSRAAWMQSELDAAMKGGKNTWASIPIDFEPYWFYAGLDTILTYRLCDVLKPQVDATCPKAYELELYTSLLCADMEQHGALIDRQYAGLHLDKMHRQCKEILDWCKEKYGVSPGSNAQVVQALKDEGFTFEKKTAKGADCLDKEVLESIPHELAEAVLTRRQALKIASTYLDHFVYDIGEDNRIYPGINSSKARTGRMSMENPNLQNLPRKGTSTFGDTVRGCIIAPKGHTLLMCDFNQIEWRLFASISKDRAMIDAFLEGDFFTNMCRMLFGDESITKDDPRRQVTKNAMYARIYGAGDEKFSVTAGIGLHEAKYFNGLLDTQFPSIHSLQRTIINTAESRQTSIQAPYVSSPLTGRRFAAEHDSAYKLVNYLFQGVAAEVLKMKLLELHAAGLGPYMVAPVHDEIIMEVPDDVLPDVARQVLSIMNDHTMFAVPVTADTAIGTRWSEKTDYTPGD